MFELNMLGMVYLGVTGGISLLLFIAIITMLARKKATTAGTSFFRFIDVIFLICSLAVLGACVLANYEIFGLSVVSDTGALVIMYNSNSLLSIPSIGDLVAIFTTLVGMILSGAFFILSFLALIICGARRHKVKKQAVASQPISNQEEVSPVLEEVQAVEQEAQIEQLAEEVQATIKEEEQPVVEEPKEEMDSKFKYTVYYGVPDESSEVYDRVVELDDTKAVAEEPQVEAEIIKQTVEVKAKPVTNKSAAKKPVSTKSRAAASKQTASEKPAKKTVVGTGAKKAAQTSASRVRTSSNLPAQRIVILDDDIRKRIIADYVGSINKDEDNSINITMTTIKR